MKTDVNFVLILLCIPVDGPIIPAFLLVSDLIQVASVKLK
jgi:hypothetical protein